MLPARDLVAQACPLGVLASVVSLIYRLEEPLSLCAREVPQVDWRDYLIVFGAGVVVGGVICSWFTARLLGYRTVVTAGVAASVTAAHSRHHDEPHPQPSSAEATTSVAVVSAPAASASVSGGKRRSVDPVSSTSRRIDLHA